MQNSMHVCVSTHRTVVKPVRLAAAATAACLTTFETDITHFS